MHIESHKSATVEMTPRCSRIELAVWIYFLVMVTVISPLVVIAILAIGVGLFFTEWPAWYVAGVYIVIVAAPLAHVVLGWVFGRRMRWPWWAGAGLGVILTGFGIALFLAVVLITF